MVNDSSAENKQLAAELVCNAIADLNEKKCDSTLRAIRKHIGKHYKLAPHVIDNLIVPSIQNGVQFGVIANHMGRYQLTGLMDNIADLACGRKHKRQKEGSNDDSGGKCCDPSDCCPKRKCNRSSKNFRRIDYKSADVCYEDRNNPCGSPAACESCQPACGDKESADNN